MLSFRISVAGKSPVAIPFHPTIPSNIAEEHAEPTQPKLGCHAVAPVAQERVCDCF